MPTLKDPLQSAKGERKKRGGGGGGGQKKKKNESQRHKLCHGRLTRRTDAQHYENSLSGASENMLVTDNSYKIAFVMDGAWNAVLWDGWDARQRQHGKEVKDGF